MRKYSDEEYDKRFKRLVSINDGCHDWLGMVSPGGYGQFAKRGKKVAAHRYAWEMVNGPIAPGLVVNHLCWNRTCVNVEHLEVVTKAENCYYRSGPSSNSTTGIRGVSWAKAQGKWRGVLYKGGKQVASKLFPGTDEGRRSAAEFVKEGRARLYGRHAGI